MKVKIALATGGAGIILALVGQAHAGEMRMAPPAMGIPAIKPVCDTFDASSLGFDVFGVAVIPSDDMFDASAGGGLGVTSYLNSHLGFSGNAYWWNDGDSAVTSITGNIILRFPIRSCCIAPYVTAGLGGHFNSVNQFTTQVGAGVEFAVPHVTDWMFFAEGTYTFADTTDNYTTIRLGTRYNF